MARAHARFGQKRPIASAQSNFGSDFIKQPKEKVAVVYQKDGDDSEDRGCRLEPGCSEDSYDGLWQ